MNQHNSDNQDLVVACAPKSGSTYLSTILSMLPGMRRAHLVPIHERREQELCEQQITTEQAVTASMQGLWDAKELNTEHRPRGFVAQHHVRCSRHTVRMVRRQRLTPIVLVRDIYDTIPSLRDHLRRAENGRKLPMAFVDDAFLDLDDPAAELFIARMIIPWYFNFFASWHAAELPVSPLWTTYTRLVDDPAGTIADVAAAAGLEVASNEIDTAVAAAGQANTRRNKAVAGRGGALQPEVRDLISAYAGYYPGIDFSQFGIGADLKT